VVDLFCIERVIYLVFIILEKRSVAVKHSCNASAIAGSNFFSGLQYANYLRVADNYYFLASLQPIELFAKVLS
jgi:hypothetical protein